MIRKELFCVKDSSLPLTSRQLFREEIKHDG